MTRGPEVLYPPPLGTSPPPPPAEPESDALGRLSPQQVLLGTGAIALVAAGAASLASVGSGAGRWVLAVLAVATTAASLRAGRRGLRTSEEALAAAAVVLAAVGARSTGDPAAEPTLLLAGLAVVFAVLGRVARGAAAWPIASWCAAQLAVFTFVTGTDLAAGPQAAVVLATALAGQVIAVRARRPVSEVAALTTAAWWLTGVAQGTVLVWTTSDVGAATGVGVLLVAAAAGLALQRLRRSLHPLLGPRPAAPVLAGVVAGSAVAGVLQSTGPAGVPAAGYLGLVLAAAVAETASPRPDSLLRPAGLALASTSTLLAVVQLLAQGRWTALGVLLLAAALPAVLVAARQPADRPGALPVAVGCLAAAVLLFEADGTLSPGTGGRLLLALTVLALGAAALLRRHRSEVPVAWSAVVVGLIALGHVAERGDLRALSIELAVLGAALTGYAAVTGRDPARAGGCLCLVLAAWTAAGSAEVHVPEAYTLPAAAALLLFSGQRLATGASWPAWGPALLTGFVPSVVLSLIEPDLTRVVLVVLAATLAATAGTRWQVQAPFVVGAVSLVTVAVGRLVAAVPAPGLVALAAAGAALLAVGAAYEDRRRRAIAAVARVADLR